MSLTTPTRRVARAVAAVAVAAALSATSVAWAGSSHSGKRTAGGTATLALPPGTTPDFIFPLVDGAHYSVANIEQFQRLMWRPLYMYGKNGQPVVNDGASLAEPPVFGKGNTQVTIKLKNYTWSDGKPVTSRDFTFLFNLLRANKKSWAAYLPGDMPDNVKSVKVVDDHTFTLMLDRAYSPIWFTGNQLSQLMPIPQHAWDVKAAGGPVGDYDLTPAGAKAVYTYLIGEAKKPQSYATNPLWQIVDGPWKLSAYRTDGYSEFVPNPKYSGPVKPTLDKFIEQPFTTAQAELNVLRSGGIDYGYLPQSEVAQTKALEGQGYTFSPWVSWGINYIAVQLREPEGRADLQAALRPPGDADADRPERLREGLFKGYGSPTNGPVPIKPANDLVTPTSRAGRTSTTRTRPPHCSSRTAGTIHTDGDDLRVAAPANCGAGIKTGHEARVRHDLRLGRPGREPAGAGAASRRPPRPACSSTSLRSRSTRSSPRRLRARRARPARGRSSTGAAAGSTASTRCRPATSSSCAAPAPTSAPTATQTNDANIHGLHPQGGSGADDQFQNYMAKQLPVVSCRTVPTSSR